MAKNLKNVTPKGSDNLVEEISEDFDRFEAWVIGNGKYLIAGCIVIVIAVAIFFSVVAIRNSNARYDAEMFAKANTQEEILAALKKAPSAASATDARFRLASIYLADKKYQAAREQFELLAKRASDPFFVAKASLSLGYLDELEGKQENALKIFVGIADNVQTQNDLRAEAAYAAGRIYAAQKNFERARVYLSRFRPGAGAAGLWGTYSNMLLRQLPAMPVPAAASVPAPAPVKK